MGMPFSMCKEHILISTGYILSNWGEIKCNFYMKKKGTDENLLIKTLLGLKFLAGQEIIPCWTRGSFSFHVFVILYNILLLVGPSMPNDFEFKDTVLYSFLGMVVC